MYITDFSVPSLYPKSMQFFTLVGTCMIIKNVQYERGKEPSFLSQKFFLIAKEIIIENVCNSIPPLSYCFLRAWTARVHVCECACVVNVGNGYSALQTFTNSLQYHCISQICIMEILSYEDCTSNSSSDISKCCSLCPPGQGQVKKCTNETDTKCQPCENGKSFSSSKYDTNPCKKCRTCRDMERELSPCNTTHDAVCGCLLDFYFTEELKKCQLCDLCPYGSGAIVACSTNSNSVCRKCENGTFSDVKSATSTCRPCSVCSPTQFTIMDCTDQQDTICLGKYSVPTTINMTSCVQVSIYS